MKYLMHICGELFNINYRCGWNKGIQVNGCGISNETLHIRNERGIYHDNCKIFGNLISKVPKPDVTGKCLLHGKL